MRRGYWMAMPLLLLAAGLLAQDKKDDKGEFVLRVDVPVVSLEAVIQDRNGRALTHFTQSDFQIFEDGVQQDIAYFGSADTPRSVLLMLDTSFLVENNRDLMIEWIDLFLQNTRPQDRVAVGGFDVDFEMMKNFGLIDPRKPPKIKLPPWTLGTNLYEALKHATGRFDKEKGRKAIIVITDGRENSTWYEARKLGDVLTLQQDDNFKSVLKDVRKKGIPLYFIALNTDPRYISGPDVEYAELKDPKRYPSTQEYRDGKRSPTIAEDYLKAVRLRLEKLAEATGGMVIYPRSLNEVAGLYRQIAQELSIAYSIGYSPKNGLDDGKAHKIEVRMKDPAVRVIQSRDSYGGAAN